MDCTRKLLPETKTACYARALMPNHVLSPWAKIAIDEITKYPHPDYEKAEAYMKIAIEEGPDEDGSHFHLSFIYYRQGKMKLALEEALTAERLSSKEDLAISSSITGPVATVP